MYAADRNNPVDRRPQASGGGSIPSEASRSDVRGPGSKQRWRIQDTFYMQSARLNLPRSASQCDGASRPTSSNRRTAAEAARAARCGRSGERQGDDEQ